MNAVSIGKERKFYNGTGPITRLAVSSSIYRVFLMFESKISHFDLVDEVMGLLYSKGF